MSRISNIEQDMHQLLETFMMSFEFLRSQQNKIDENTEDHQKLQEFGEKLGKQALDINNQIDTLSIYDLVSQQQVNEDPDDMLQLDENDNKKKLDKQESFLKTQQIHLEKIQQKRENEIQEHLQKKKQLTELNGKFRTAIEKCSQNFFDIGDITDDYQQQQQQNSNTINNNNNLNNNSNNIDGELNIDDNQQNDIQQQQQQQQQPQQQNNSSLQDDFNISAQQQQQQQQPHQHLQQPYNTDNNDMGNLSNNNNIDMGNINNNNNDNINNIEGQQQYQQQNYDMDIEQQNQQQQQDDNMMTF